MRLSKEIMDRSAHYNWLCNMGLRETQWFVGRFPTPFDLWNPYI